MQCVTKGVWWLPAAPENRFFGDLTYGSTAGAQLSLLDYFTEDSSLRHDFTIWGEASGRPVSLFKCFTRTVRGLRGGLTERTSEIEAQCTIIGGNFGTPAEMRCAQVTAEISYLYDWASQTGVTCATQGSICRIAVGRMPQVSFGSLGGLTVTLRIVPTVSQKQLDEWRVSETCVLCIEAPELTSFAKFEEVIKKIQQFLAFAVCRPVYILSTKARTDEPIAIVRDVPFFNELEIIRNLSVDDSNRGKPSFGEMLFTLPNLSSEPSGFISRFFEKQGPLQPVWDLYLSTLYQPDMFVRQKFLTLAQAVEAYHRAAFECGAYQTKEAYENGLKKRLLAAIPDDLEPEFRASLKNKFNYLHEYSLNRRIKEICSMLSEDLQGLLGDSGAFSRAITNTRNLLTHAGPNSTEFELADLHWKSEQLGILIEVCMLHELGFDTAAVKALLSRNRRAWRLKERARAEAEKTLAITEHGLC